MTYKGHIENGRVVFDDPAALAEGTRVSIEVVSAGAELEIKETSSLASRLALIIGKAEGLAPDCSEYHDRAGRSLDRRTARTL
ncbi:MAG: hypothetical protein HYV27_05750 [Candidatus Hydrogenedentes bacterium]|nr:hypothetical protein [Candidatus Hydrogenedentota bacterium]